MAVLLLVVVVVNEAPVVQSGNLSGFIVKLYQPFDHNCFATFSHQDNNCRGCQIRSGDVEQVFWQQRRTTTKSDERTNDSKTMSSGKQFTMLKPLTLSQYS